jgi:hypothetical protein
MAFLQLILASHIGVLSRWLGALAFLYPILVWSARKALRRDLDRTGLVLHQRWYRGIYAFVGAAMLLDLLWS